MLPQYANIVGQKGAGMNKQSVFQRLIAYTIEGYLSDIDPKTTYNYYFMLKLRTQIRAYRTFHRFDKEEHDEIIKVADSEYRKNAREQQVDRTIFALELLYLYVTQKPKHKRAHLNISDNKLKGAKAELITDMLKLKQRRELEYDRVKEIISDSRISAKGYFGYCEEYFKELK